MISGYETSFDECWDLVEHWTLVGAEQDLVVAKHRDTQLGFALLLRFYGWFGRFPRVRAELHKDVVEFAARQLGVDAGSWGFYEWAGRTIKRHRAEIHAYLGFRECTVVDAEKLTDWLAGDHAQKERPFELAKDAVLAEPRLSVILSRSCCCSGEDEEVQGVNHGTGLTLRCLAQSGQACGILVVAYQLQRGVCLAAQCRRGLA